MDSKKKHLIFALVIGALAFFGNKAYLDSVREELRPRKFTTIVRAKKQIPAGSSLSRGMIEKKKIPKTFAPKAAIPWADHELYLGQELGIDVISGDYVLESYFRSRRAVGNTLSDQLDEENFRAISIPVDETNSLARSIVNGDRIDILYTFVIPVINHKMSVVLLQNIPVISTGTYSVVEQEMGGRGTRSRRYNTLTLKLSMEDAVRLNYARESGKINLLLRNREDNKLLDVSPIGGIADLLSASDRALIEKYAKERQASVPGGDKLRQQLRDVLESQRNQSSGRR